MLQIFHKYFKSVALLIVTGLVVFSMLFFGTGSDLSGQPSYALKINGEEITPGEYFNYQKDFEDRMRSTYGAAYSQIFTPELLRSQLNDLLINATLFRQFAEEIGLAVGKKDLNKLFNSLFMGNKELYATYLRSRGETAKSYEQRIEKDLLAEKVGSLIRQASYASQPEVKKAQITADKKISLQYLTIDPAKLVEQQTAPTAEAITKYYQDNASTFETEPAVSYDYLVLDPEKNLNLVPVTTEDMQIYYTDNIASYTKAEQANISQVKISFPANLDPLKQSEKKNLADEVYTKANSGEPFANLVKNYSEDAASKEKAGALGWVTAKQLDSAVSTTVFGEKKLGVLEPIIGNDGIYIIQVEAYEPEKITELSEVQEQIKAELQKRDAAAFTLAKADTLLKDWQANKADLGKIASENQLELKSATEFLSRSKDPEDTLRGLTSKVLELEPAQQQLIELGNLIILVNAKEFKARGIPTEPEVKEQIVNIMKEEAARKKAEELAGELLAKLKDKTADLNTLAKDNQLEIADYKEVTRKDPTAGFLTDPTHKDIAFAAKTMGPLLQPIKFGGKFHLAEVTSITLPDAKTASTEDLKDFQDTAENSVSSLLYQPLLNKLKLKAEIKIDPSYGTLN